MTNWPTTRDEMLELSPEEFEHFVADLWSARGYETQVVQLSRDAGKDVIAEDKGTRLAIQAKRNNRSNRVTSPEVQQYSSLLHDETIDEVAVVTTSSFSYDAHQRAQEYDMSLVDGGRLEELAERYGPPNEASSISSTSGSSSSSSSSGGLEALIAIPVKLMAWYVKVVVAFMVWYVKFMVALFTAPFKLLSGGSSKEESD